MVQITITDPSPVFTKLPSNIEVQTCGNVNLGTAQATSPCGAVQITNDAPASFKAGVHSVTWRATSPTGKYTTTSQQVVVWPGDNPACCPAGSNVIIGTSNDDVLTGTTGSDCILGLGGQDTIIGAGGNDVISGGEGNDQITCGVGNDMLLGGAGQDTLTGGPATMH